MIRFRLHNCLMRTALLAPNAEHVAAMAKATVSTTAESVIASQAEAERVRSTLVAVREPVADPQNKSAFVGSLGALTALPGPGLEAPK